MLLEGKPPDPVATTEKGVTDKEKEPWIAPRSVMNTAPFMED